MSRPTTAVGIVLTFLLVTAAVLPVASALSDEQERVFFADDEDQDAEDVDGVLSDPTTYARISDVGYRFTKPRYTVDGTSVYDFRTDQLAAMDRSRDESYELPDTGSLRNDGSIEDAHITYVGLQGGADPRLGTSYDPFVGESGSVLNLMDYRIDGSDIPDDSCDTDYDTDQIDIDDDNETETVYDSGEKVCHSYSREVDVDRELRVDGRTFTGGRTIDFHGLEGGERTLELEGEVTVTIEHERRSDSWNPTPYAADRDPDWDLERDFRRTYRTDHVEVSDSKAVYVTDGRLDVSQVAIEKPNGRYRVFLTFEGVGDDKVSKSELRDRPLWNTIEFGDQAYLDGIWRTYTMREHFHGTVHSDSGSDRVDDPPHALKQYLIATDGNVTATTVEGSGSTIRVVDSSHERFSKTGANTQGDVDLTAKRPIFFTQITVADAPGPASSYTTVHGRRYDLPTAESNPNYHELNYRRPAVTITSTGDDGRIRVHVEDPESEEPLVNRRVSLSGTNRDDDTTTTNENGNVFAAANRVLVTATVHGDSWVALDADADYYYSRVSTSRTFTGEIELMQRSYELVQMLVLLTPLVFVYFYVRHFQFLE